MSQHSFYLVDAFAEGAFGGNPAAVCPLETWLPDPVMQSMAMEHNQAETAFYVRREDGGYDLRWFTPTIEVDLCGHATLAAAFVLHRTEGLERVVFHSRSGPLTVLREGAHYVLDLPARPAAPAPLDDALSRALGSPPAALFRAERDVLALYDSEAEVAALAPDMQALYDLVGGPRLAGYIATAPGRQCHFVSRFFCPNGGIPEDPVTGSAHATLIPFWARRLGQTTMTARQLSHRGGVLLCRDNGARVDVGGKARLYAEGRIYL